MRLVGKKLYRTGPLKLFNQDTSGPGWMSDVWKAAQKKKWEEEQRKTEKAEWKKEAMRDLYDPEQKALFEKRKQLAEDVGSGAAARRGAEAGLKAQMAAAGAGRGSAASRMRGLARAQEAGVRGAAAQGAGAAQQQFGMLGQAGQGRMGMMKSDKAGRLGFYQKSRGLDVAEKAAEQQAAATRAANQSTGKASGGEIFKEFKRKNGKIEGPGTETSDSIKAMLSDGEFVVNAKTVRGIGEAMGAKGKEDSRKKGAGFLYDLQTKYGDKKPVNKMLGGLEIAELGAHAAKKGLLGKKLKGAGSIASSAIDVKKGMDAKKSDLETKEAAVQQKAHKRETEHHTEYAKGGHINLGKGVKAKRKYREAIGWESDKIFDKKAEKDYKKGDTGYKNYKGEKSVTPVKMGLGGFLGKVAKVGLGAAKGFVMSGGNPAGAVIGGAKGAMDVKAEDDQKSQAKKQAMAQAQSDEAAKKAEAGKGLAASEVQLKKGGEVSKDHPHYKFLKDLEDWEEKRNRRGKKVETDPAIKAEKAIKAKKGSVEPMKFQTGDLVEKEIKSPEGKLALQIKKFTKEQQDAYKAFLKKGMPDSIKKLGLADSEARKVWQKMALKKAQSLKHTGGDASDAERIGKAARLKKEMQEAKKKFNVRERPESMDVAEKKLKEKEKEFMSPEYQEGLKLEKKGKELENIERIKAFAKRRKRARGLREAKKKFNVREKPELLDVAKQKLLEKRKEMESDPDFKEIKEAQKKGKSLEQIERIEGFRKRQKKRRELKEAKKKFNVRERPESMDVAEEKFKEKEKEFRSPEYQEMLKLDKKGRALEKAEKDKAQQAKDVERIKAFAKRRKAARAAAQVKADDAAADKLVEKGRRETKSIMAEPKEVKKEKSWWGDMPDKDKAGIIFGAGKGLLDARQQYLKEKQARRQRIAEGERMAAATRAAAGNELIGAPVSLRKGGKVSFKDVLKAKKKMGY